MKIAICTVASYKTPLRQHEDFVSVSNELKRLYCERHGYRWIFTGDNPRPEISAQWAKFSIILHAFREHGADWAVWMDADAAPVKMDFDLEAFLATTPNDKIVMCKDILGWNSGVFAVPNCQRAFEWLDKLGSDETVKKFDPYPQRYPFKDQDAIKASFESGYSDFVIEPPKEIGWNNYDKVYAKYSNGMPNEFIEGQHWCLHIPGFYNGYRKKRFEHFLSKANCVSCPVCGQDSVFYIAKPETEYATDHYFKCPHCGLIFLPTDIQGEKAEQRELDLLRQKDVIERDERVAANDAIRRLSGFLGEHQPSILEIGIGKGLFTDACRQFGLTADFERVIPPYETRWQGDERKYSLVVGLDILQRMLSEDTLFNTVNHRLLTGGFFIICNPLYDRHAICRITPTGKWPFLNASEWRMRLHSSRSIELLAAKHGFNYLQDMGDGSWQCFVKMRDDN